MITFDQYTADAGGIFLMNQLEKYDPTINAPLIATTWGRDIDLRTDVSIIDEYASYNLTNFASVGGITPGGKSWAAKQTTALAGPALDITKPVNPLHLWAEMPSWSLIELYQSQYLGRPIDTAKIDVVMEKWEMDTDEQVYIGDTGFNVPGLFNSPLVTPIAAKTVNNGAGNTTLWAGKTPQQALDDVNTLLLSVQVASGYTNVPTHLRLPAGALSFLTSTLVSAAGTVSIATFLAQNSIATVVNGKPLDIAFVKWLDGLGAGGTNRMVAYTKSPKFVQFPRSVLMPGQLQNRGMDQMIPYMGKLGVVELRYPETVGYMDGI